MKKFLLSFLLLVGICAAQSVQTAGRSTNNTFTGINQFTQGIETGPVVFSQLVGLTGAINFVYVSDASPTNPCTGGGTGAFAYYTSGQWNCTTNINTAIINAAQVTAQAGLQAIPPAQPMDTIPVDPTGTCDYPSGWYGVGEAQLCNPGNSSLFPIDVNTGNGNFALLAIRPPASIPANGSVPCYVAANSDFELNAPCAIPSLNGTVFVDGIVIPTVEAAIKALPAPGGKIRTKDGFSETFTSQIDLGSSTQSVVLELGANSVLTCAVTGGAGKSCLVIHNGSVLKGNGFDTTVSKIATSAVNVDSVITCGECTTAAQEYFGLENLSIRGDATSSTINHAVIELVGMFAPSYIRDITAFNFANTIGLWVHATATAGTDVFTISNVWMNGSNNTGARPCVLSVDSGTTNVLDGITWLGGACEHSGTSNRVLEVNGNGTTNLLFGVGFQTLQVEPNPSATVDPILVEDARGINFFGGVLKAAGTLYSADVSQSTSNTTDSIGFWNTHGLGGVGCLDNTITSRTLACNGSTFTYFYSLGGILQQGSPIFDGGINTNYATVNSAITAGGTAATLTGTGACLTASLSAQTGGSWSGQVTCGGTTGASTLTISPSAAAAPHGWKCGGSDTTSGHELAGAQSGIATSTCTLKFASVTAGDVISFDANQY